MSEDKPPAPNIGINVVNELYTNCRLEANAPQPIYLIYKDTIKTFLHEKSSLLALDAKILGLIGIEVSLLAALFTAKFEDLWKIKGELVQALFIAFVVVLGFFLVRDAKRWWQNRKGLTVDALTDELGARGSTIKSHTDGDTSKNQG